MKRSSIVPSRAESTSSSHARSSLCSNECLDASAIQCLSCASPNQVSLSLLPLTDRTDVRAQIRIACNADKSRRHLVPSLLSCRAALVHRPISKIADSRPTPREKLVIALRLSVLGSFELLARTTHPQSLLVKPVLNTAMKVVNL